MESACGLIEGAGEGEVFPGCSHFPQRPRITADNGLGSDGTDGMKTWGGGILEPDPVISTLTPVSCALAVLDVQLHYPQTIFVRIH